MVPVRFNPEEDFAPLPFDKITCHMAADLKTLGLDWKPHVGCFVWDPEAFINVESPFPGNVYFILSLLDQISVCFQGNELSTCEKLSPGI